jgi:hypothetical protein
MLQAKRLYLHGEGKLLPPMPSSFAKEMEEDSPTVVLRRLKDNTFPDETLTGNHTHFGAHGYHQQHRQFPPWFLPVQLPGF